MQQYDITGMSCAACSARIEKEVSKVEGVDSVSVNLLLNTMLVEGAVDSQTIISAVEAAGYGATVAGIDCVQGKDEGEENHTSKNSKKDENILRLRNRLITSLALLLPLMYVSMGHKMWGWPVPHVLASNHLALGLIEFVLTSVILVINRQFFINGCKGVLHGAPNMDTLVAVGAGASYVYSLVMLAFMVIKGNPANITDVNKADILEKLMHYHHEFYFESAATIVTLITLGKLLEAISKGRTTDALQGLMDLAPKKATLLVDGVYKEVDIKEVKVGDTFVVKPGESIPVDGVVLDGVSAIDESALTGESIPIDKQPGDMISAATINQSGFLTCEATKIGEETILSQIIRMVRDAGATKAPIAKAADKIAGVFVPAVMVIAAVTLAVWLLAGETIGFSLTRAISVLVISCPCALGLATPVAIMVGNGMGAKNGILFKHAAAMEHMGKIKAIALDKTGTITTGKPKVTDISASKDITEEELLQVAYALERRSEHPLAYAIVSFCEEIGVREAYQVDDFEAVVGNGLKGTIDGDTVFGGNVRFLKEYFAFDENLLPDNTFAKEGKTPIYFGWLDKEKKANLFGVIAVADVVKTDSKQAIAELQELGIDVVMLTGDNERTAQAIGEQIGIDEKHIVAGILPARKEQTVKDLQQSYGMVAMVGDGINDSPALTTADIGVAVGGGTDIAIDAADVVLMKNSLLDVAAAIRLSRATRATIHQNLFWAFIYNIIGIPLAAGVWIPIFGWTLRPMFGAAAMSLSSFCVVTNALRLNLKKIYKTKKQQAAEHTMNHVKDEVQDDTMVVKNNVTDKEDNTVFDETISKENEKMKGDTTMTKTMKIEGMMCGHCEARVQKCLLAVEGVTEAIVSHETGTAEVHMETEIADDVLRQTVEAQDYKVTGIL